MLQQSDAQLPPGTSPGSAGPASESSAPRCAPNLAAGGLALLLTLLAMLAVGALLAGCWGRLMVLVDGLKAHSLGWIFLVVCLAVTVFNLLVFLWRVVLVLRYRNGPVASDDQLPTCSVIVPAYNEGPAVVQTLLSLAGCDYPAHRLQIIAVDDGSVDDTWRWMQQAAASAPGRIELVQLEHNLGKRFALHKGFSYAKGDILVTVDSDSIVEPGALRRLVSGFMDGPCVGSVGGNIRVLNRSDGPVPRMLDVTFAYSFDFIRSSQSMVDTVMCIPGAMAAYRRTAIEGLLEEWVAQTFMGRPANIGEDRALTNLILRAGYACRYRGDALCRTTVPADYRGLCRMFIRWARSNVRETLAMARFAFGPFRRGRKLGARVNLVHQCVGMFVYPLLLLGAIALVWPFPAAGVVNFLVGCCVASCVPAAFYALRIRNASGLWAFPYGLFWLLGLSWINIYALLTPHKSAWLTRQIQPAKPAQK